MLNRLLARTGRCHPSFCCIGLSSLLALGLFNGPKAGAQPGLVDPTFNAGITNSTVADLILQPDGRIVVRTGFPDYALARLEKDGALDSSFNPGLPLGSKVNWMGSQPDGKIVIAGNFLEVQGVPRPCLARLNADGTLNDSFVPQIIAANIPPPPTNAPPMSSTPTNSIGMLLVQPDGKVLVSEMFYMTATNGSKLPALIRFNSDGSIDNTFAVFTNTPYRMALQSDGKILIAQTIYWNPYPGSNTVYRLNSDGTRDPSFTQVNIAGWVNTFSLQDANIIIGGYIFRVNGINSGWVARLNANGQLDTSFHSDAYDYGNGVITAIPQVGGKVLIAGTFWNTGSSNRNLARLNPNGSRDTTYASTGANSYVYALASQPDGKVLVGGEFTTISGASVPRLARLTGDSDAGPGTVVFDSPTVEVFENAGSVTLTVNRIWGKQGDVTVNYQTQAGSAVADSDYEEQSGILVFHDGETTKNLTVPINDDSFIEDLESFQVMLSEPGGGVIVGAQSNCVVKILDDDGPASFDPTFAVHQGVLDGAVNGVVIQSDERLVVGGWFQQVSGVPRKGVARLNQNGTLDTAFDPGSGLDFGGNAGWLNLVKLQGDGKLLVAGIFNKVNGTNRNYVARLNSDGSLDTSFDDGSGPAAGGIVGDVWGMEMLADGRIIVGGCFTTYNGIARNGLARLNTNGTVDASYQPAGANTVVPFGLKTDGKIVFAGMWDDYARCINADGTTTRTNADGTTNIIFIVTANNIIRQISSLPDGNTMLAGSFTSLNGQARRCLARLLPDGSVDATFVPDLNLFWNGSSSPYIYRFAVQADGKVLAAVKSYVSPSGNYLVRFHNDGTLDSDFEPMRFAIPAGDNDTISTISFQSDNKIIVGGQFQTVNDLSRPYLVRLKGGDKSGSRPLLVKSLDLLVGQCGLSLAVAPAKPFVLQTSTDMLNWKDLSTNTVLTSTFYVIDDRIAGSDRCFYRVKQLVP